MTTASELRAMADILLKAAEEMERVQEALRPFSAIADWFDSFAAPPPSSDLLAYGDYERRLRIGDFRRARAALVVEERD